VPEQKIVHHFAVQIKVILDEYVASMSSAPIVAKQIAFAKPHGLGHRLRIKELPLDIGLRCRILELPAIFAQRLRIKEPPTSVEQRLRVKPVVFPARCKKRRHQKEVRATKHRTD
jgi:hypothetical protein